MDEDEILHWLLSHLENDEIEDIDEDTLERMVKEGRTMAVLFCKNFCLTKISEKKIIFLNFLIFKSFFLISKLFNFNKHQNTFLLNYLTPDDNNDKKSDKVLAELENIDDECDQLGIAFVKIDNTDEAKEYGIDKLPKLLYFEKGIPTVYEGNLEKEEEVLRWMELQTSSDEIEDVTDEMLDIIISKMHHVAVLFCKWSSSFHL